MFAVPVYSPGAHQANMEQTHNLFSWLSQIDAELRALRTWFQKMENRPIVQVGMQSLQDLEARVSRLETPAQSAEVLQQILQRLDLILDLVHNLDSNAIGWPPLQCQPSTSGLTSGAANRLQEEASNLEKTDQHFCTLNGTNISNAAVVTMEELDSHELPTSGSKSILASSQARLDPTTPPFAPSTAKQPTKEDSSPTRRSAHGSDQSHRPSAALARLEALGHPLEQSMHAPKSIVSTPLPLHATRTSNSALEDELRSSFLERLQQCGIKFSQPQQIAAPRDTGDHEDNALGISEQSLQIPTRDERGLSLDANQGKDHDNSPSLRNLEMVQQMLAGNPMKENNPLGARKVQEPFKAESAHLSNKIYSASHLSTYDSPSTVLKMINSDFFNKDQKSYATRSPSKHELKSTQAGSLSSPKPAIFENASVSDVKNLSISGKSGDKSMPYSVQS
ncbi:MAG: hypothetical protein Q9214_002547, partial [Letrouitia sp. 1 TL-2023]